MALARTETQCGFTSTISYPRTYSHFRVWMIAAGCSHRRGGFIFAAYGSPNQIFRLSHTIEILDDRHAAITMPG
jgi:hypothetical protein